ncbi:MAG: hypothetical protein WKG07_34990 [Hymenobacter sp.]
MAVWLLSGIRRRWCVLAQMVLVVSMNSLEFLARPRPAAVGPLQRRICQACSCCCCIITNSCPRPTPTLTR